MSLLNKIFIYLIIMFFGGILTQIINLYIFLPYYYEIPHKNFLIVGFIVSLIIALILIGLIWLYSFNNKLKLNNYIINIYNKFKQKKQLWFVANELIP